MAAASPGPELKPRPSFLWASVYSSEKCTLCVAFWGFLGTNVYKLPRGKLAASRHSTVDFDSASSLPSMLLAMVTTKSKGTDCRLKHFSDCPIWTVFRFHGTAVQKCPYEIAYIPHRLDEKAKTQIGKKFVLMLGPYRLSKMSRTYLPIQDTLC